MPDNQRYTAVLVQQIAALESQLQAANVRIMSLIGNTAFLRYDNEAKVFVCDCGVLSQGTTADEAIEAAQSAVRLMIETQHDQLQQQLAAKDAELRVSKQLQFETYSNSESAIDRANANYSRLESELQEARRQFKELQNTPMAKPLRDNTELKQENARLADKLLEAKEALEAIVPPNDGREYDAGRNYCGRIAKAALAKLEEKP